MERKVDTEGELSSPPHTPGEDGERVGPLLIEIPLWRFGRIKLESHNPKSSLAIFAFMVLGGLVVVLSFLEALGGAFGAALPGIGAILGKAGEALLIIVGVMLGAYNGKRE